MASNLKEEKKWRVKLKEKNKKISQIKKIKSKEWKPNLKE